MRRNEIIRTLQEKDSTILSFPNRGPWGNPNPVRPGILCVDAFNDDVPEEFLNADMIFMHPPYGLEIGIPYAGSMYPDPTGELSTHDLGQMPWEQFMKTLNAVIMKYYAAMEPGAYMSVLMGDVRKKGKFYSMMKDIVVPGELQQIYIKEQHNVLSTGKNYANRNYSPIAHEFLYVIKKNHIYTIVFQVPQKHELDIRDSKQATWRDVLSSALRNIGGKGTNGDLYKEVENYQKVKNNPNYKAKIRQTLRRYVNTFHEHNGVWELIA